jgi:mannose-6-phosphate isomerase-like protein (cupin superfamily)
MSPVDPASIRSPEQSPTEKWVRDPIGRGEHPIYPLSVIRDRRSNAIAPFDAALPYTAAAALGVGIEPAHAFDVIGAKARLCAGDGGYEIVHESARLEIFVYTLVAPEPDHRLLNAEDELFIVLEGTGMLDVGGEQLELREGHLAFVPAGADHCFTAYEHLTLLAIHARTGAGPERNSNTESKGVAPCDA